MTNHAVSNRADLRERTKTMSRHGDRRGQIADFRDSFETINWLYLLFKCGIKTKTHFEWLLWHWSSLRQLNLEPTRPRGLQSANWPREDQCQRSHAHGFSLYRQTQATTILEGQNWPRVKRHLKMSSVKCQPICLGLNVLNFALSYWSKQKNISFTYHSYYTSFTETCSTLTDTSHCAFIVYFELQHKHKLWHSQFP